MFGDCTKCCTAAGAAFLVLGILFLLKDLGVWNFWSINWWTALFLFAGISGLACKYCPVCSKNNKNANKKEKK